jgi:hypothetical protein
MPSYLTARFAFGLAAVLLALAGCSSKETRALLQPPQALGNVLASEAAHAAGAKKQVAVISPDVNWGPTSTAEDAFRAAMKKQGFSVINAGSVNLGDPMRARPALKAGDFFGALERSAEAGAVVSFAGAPLLTQGDVDRLRSGQHPPVLVVATMTLGAVPGVATDRSFLGDLLDAGAIQLAIVDGAEPSGSPPDKGDADRALFAQNYRILRSAR